LEEGNRIIKGDEALKEYITEYYKRLFGPAECTDFSLNENMRNDLTQISGEDNEKLVACFTVKEVKRQILTSNIIDLRVLMDSLLNFIKCFRRLLKKS
jgi:hypothetical protein